MSYGWARTCVAALCLMAVAPAWGQSKTTTPEAEYKKLIRVDQDIHPLGKHPFGEDISLYNGQLSFHAVDVSARGTGPVMELTRTFRVEGQQGFWGRERDNAFGDWILDLPRIQTYYANGYVYNASTGGTQPVKGWTVDTTMSGASPYARCSQFGGPPGDIFPIRTAPTDWAPDEWWRGYQLVIPGAGSQDLLANANAATKGTFPAVTKQHWRISCINETTTANGQPGDGFIAHAPDGTKYYFNELVYRYAPSVQKASDSSAAVPGHQKGFMHELFDDPSQAVPTLVALLSGSAPARALANNSGTSSLFRGDAWMLVTRIEDRFGNYLTFSYNGYGRLTGIKASDGRALSVTYESNGTRIHSITLQPASGSSRTWTYAYTVDTSNTSSNYGVTLTTVTQPDGRHWQYGLSAFDAGSLQSVNSSSCMTPTAPDDMTAKTGTIVHPFGADRYLHGSTHEAWPLGCPTPMHVHAVPQ